jgi:ribosomal protein S18 acetylase RimI-like enzyme/predicted nucleotidyltransferase
MIHIDQSDYQIIDNILKKYPYSFYVYGSRVKGKQQEFSDLDLYVLDETASSLELSYLQEDLAESNLPFTVDVTFWQDMQKDFQELISKDLTLLQANPKFIDAEDNLFESITYLPKMFKYDCLEDDSVSIINCARNTSMFNIVCRTNLAGNIALQIDQIIKKYKGQPFAWWLGPSDKPASMGDFLEQAGLKKETSEYAMFCDMEGMKPFQLDTNIVIKQVKSKEQLRDFIQTLSAYDKFAGHFLNNDLIFSAKILERNPLFVSYINDKPVGNGSLHFTKNIAGIYDIVTPKEFRLQGIGTNMMKYLMNFAQQRNTKQLCLAASSDSGLRIYSKLGFKIIGMFECYEWPGDKEK